MIEKEDCNALKEFNNPFKNDTRNLDVKTNINQLNNPFLQEFIIEKSKFKFSKEHQDKNIINRVKIKNKEKIQLLDDHDDEKTLPDGWGEINGSMQEQNKQEDT
jgi:hypothetical protein